MTLKDNQCIVAMADDGTGWILTMSEYLRDHDVLIEPNAEDNGFERGWDSGLATGLYLVDIEPEEYYDTRTGDFDVVIEVKNVKCVWSLGTVKAPDTPEEARLMHLLSDHYLKSNGDE